MAIDPRIALGVQPLQLENPLQQYGNALKIQSAKMEMDAARRAEKERNAINALYQQAYAGGGDIENALLQGAASQGLGYKIPEFQKSFAESKTAKFNQLKTLAELQKRTATIIMQNPDFAEPAIADFERQTGQDLSSLRMQIGQLRGNPDAVRRLAAGYALDADKMLPKTEVRDMGGAVTATNIDPITGRPVEQYSLGDKTMTPGEAANLPINQARLANERQRLANEQQRFVLDMQKFEREGSGGGEVTYQTDAEGNLIALPKTVGSGGVKATPVMTADGKPAKGKLSAGAEKAKLARQQMKTDIDMLVPELEAISAEGGLIDQSTGSGAGRAVDTTAGFFGMDTSGAIAGSRLAPIADMALKLVPRFEGPQSDKDTQSYKEAAGQLADTSITRERRKAAAREIVRIMKARRNQFVPAGMEFEPEAQPTPAAPSGASVTNW